MSTFTCFDVNKSHYLWLTMAARGLTMLSFQPGAMCIVIDSTNINIMIDITFDEQNFYIMINYNT